MGIVSSMLCMIDKEHGILINDEIGLIGNASYEIKKSHGDLYIAGQENQYKLGDYFEVICDKGYKLFDEYVVSIGIIMNDTGVNGYIFELKDYNVEDALNDFFGFQKSKFAAILCMKDNTGDNVLYTNCKSLKHKYKFSDSIEYTDSICEIFGKQYRKIIKDYNNNIFTLLERGKSNGKE